MKKITTEGKRPAAATPEKALELYQSGLSMVAIGKMWNICRMRVWQLIQKAKKNNQ